MDNTTYVTIRIDFESDGRFDWREASELAALMVVERASLHNHTIENGIRIQNIESCGVND